jgi:hypothetical protein
MSIVRGCPKLRGPVLANMAVFLAAIPDDAVQVCYRMLYNCAVISCADLEACNTLYQRRGVDDTPGISSLQRAPAFGVVAVGDVLLVSAFLTG